MIPQDVRETIHSALDTEYGRLYKILDRPELSDNYRNGTTAQMAQVKAARAWLDSQPQMPQPDWSQAPEWAVGHAYGATGDGIWVGHNLSLRSGLKLPLGIDWRIAGEQRPQQREESA